MKKERWSIHFNLKMSISTAWHQRLSIPRTHTIYTNGRSSSRTISLLIRVLGQIENLQSDKMYIKQKRILFHKTNQKTTISIVDKQIYDFQIKLNCNCDTVDKLWRRLLCVFHRKNGYSAWYCLFSKGMSCKCTWFIWNGGVTKQKKLSEKSLEKADFIANCLLRSNELICAMYGYLIYTFLS